MSLGFTDNTGSPAGNHRLSIERAEWIAKMLLRAKMNVAWTGLGQELPVDTNDTEEGRKHNRRAEVWVVPE